MKKPSDTSTSFLLSSVSFKGNDRILSFGKKTLLLSKEDYFSSYFYPGKAFSEEERAKLEEKSRLRKAQNGLHSLLRRRPYTEKEASDRLKNHYGLSEKEAKTLLQPYIQDGIIDDKAYARDYFLRKKEEGYGNAYIFQKLKRKGIPSSLIDSLPEEEEKDDEKTVLSLIGKKDKSSIHKPEKKRKQEIYAFLLRRGFSSLKAKALTERYFSSLPKERPEEAKKNQSEYLKKEGEKCYNAVRKKNTDPFRKKAAFLRRRMERGFKEEDIEAFLNERGYTFYD